MVVTLVELDEQNRENALNQAIASKLLQELNASGGAINERLLVGVLRGNDLLGVKSYRLYELNAGIEQETTFSGSVLLDKYRYSFYWKLY